MRILCFIYFLIILIYSCNELRSLSAIPAVDYYKSQSAVKIELGELLLNRGQYQGKLIETKGVFLYGDHGLVISLTKEELISRPQQFMEYQTVLIEPHPKLKLPYDTLRLYRNKVVKVRGTFDSSLTGFRGMNAGALINVYTFE